MKWVVSGGLIVDGTGKQPYAADVLMHRDQIAGIGDFGEVTDAHCVHAAGMIVTPGLVDAHTHAELNLMQNRQQPNSVYQGISTMITGQCGLGFVPMEEGQLEDSVRMNSGIFGGLPAYCKRWQDYPDYMALLDGCAVNAGALVSHNAIRQISCGFANVPLQGKRLDRSLQALEGALEAGALGLSVGLSYYPGGYSDTDELIALCRMVKKHDAVFCVHMRLDVHDPRFSAEEEIVKVIEATGVRTNLLHHRTGGMEHFSAVIAPFAGAIQQGAEVTFEYYPYLVGSGLLMAVLPDWAQEGGPDAILDRLTDKALRPELMKDLIHRYGFFFPPQADGRIYLTKDPHDDARGKTLHEIAAKHRETVYETVIRLLVENDLSVGFHGVEYQDEALKQKLYDDQYHLFMDERYTIGSDSIPSGGLSHRRTSGAFARVIAQMRQRGVPVETIIQKLSGKPAAIYGLKDRGTLQVGKKADVCIMDYDAVLDGADEAFSRRKPEGIHTLFVNGLPVMLDGTITGELSGCAVHRSR